MNYYVSSDGDVLDQIVVNHYAANIDRSVEAVLAANPGLAQLGPVLGPNVRILLPDLADSQEPETVQLWA